MSKPFNQLVDFGKIAYDAYCEKSKGVSLISGAKLPDFEALSDEIKDAWRAAAEAVIYYN